MMTDQLALLTDRLISAARSAGADAADAMAAGGSSISVDVRKGVLEQAERAEGTEIGLRVLVGQKQACVSASDSSARTITEIAERAVAMAREAPEDASLGLADQADLARTWDIAELELADPSAEPSPAELERDARAAEEAALAVGGVTQMDSAGAGYSRRSVHIAMTSGFSGGYTRTSRSVSAVAISGEGLGMERDWAAESRSWQSDLPSPESVGRLAGERAVARHGARKPPTGGAPVLYDERVAGSLIGHLLAAVNGSAIVRGASWLLDAMGAEILPPGLSLIEDPHRPRIGTSRPFDAEGLPTRRQAVVSEGRLSRWLLDLGTSRRLGLQSTGNAGRGPGSPPSPTATSVALTEGTASREDLMRDMGRGLYITSMLGASVNPTTGDYSRGAAGFWIEGGRIAYPVNECTIAGNLREMLRTLVPANDARKHQSIVVPSLLVGGLTIAGK